MKWYLGPIQSAIAEAKTERKIFLVFIEGDDEPSKVMSETYNENGVSESLKDDCVAIKLATNSDQFRMFSQIYPVIIVPSSFFIGIDGVPLEVVGGKVSVEEFETKIENALKLHKSKVSNLSSANAEGATSSQQPDPPLDDKVERAKQLIEERRLQKLREERDEEKRKEMEKRRVGRELQKFKEEQEKKEMMKWAEERQREKQEDKLARERIKAQIAQDRADRIARQQNTAPAATSENSEASSSVERSSPPPPAAAASNSNQCRIQFRLPDASTRTQEFEATDKMNSVFGFVQRVIGFSNIILATTFPRRQYTKKENGNSTLRELGLVPSCVLIIIPNSSVSGSSLSTGRGGGGILSIFYSLLTPLFFVWNLMLSFVGRGGTAQPTIAPPPVTSQNNPRHPDSAANRASSSSSSAAPASNARPTANDARPGSSAGSSNNSPSQRYRRDGNIHRLANDSPDDDDENNTWNGNSTQQL